MRLPAIQLMWPVTAALVLIAAFMCIAGTTRFLRAAVDNDADYIATQKGHMRRLDGASAEGRVVFLGSSTFQGLDVSAITPIGLNLSIGGDTLSGLTERASKYKSLSTARAIVVNIGLNDVLKHCVVPEVRVHDLVARAPKDTPIILVGVQELTAINGSKFCNSDKLSDLINTFNKALSDACNGMPRCQFIRNPVAFNTDEATREALLEQDGIHLSPAAYSQLSESLRQALSGVGMPPPFVAR